MSKQVKHNASDAYASQHAEALQVLSDLHEALNNLPAADGEQIHWGHVGNVGYVTARLKEVTAFLKSIDVVREIAKHKSAAS